MPPGGGRHSMMTQVPTELAKVFTYCAEQCASANSDRFLMDVNILTDLKILKPLKNR